MLSVNSLLCQISSPVFLFRATRSPRLPPGARITWSPSTSGMPL